MPPRSARPSARSRAGTRAHGPGSRAHLGTNLVADEGGGLAEVLHDGVRVGSGALELLLAVAREHEVRPRADGSTESHVAAVVPDHPRLLRVEPEGVGRALDHQRARLPARAPLFREVRTHLDAVQLHAPFGEQLAQAVVDRAQLVGADQAAPDRGLVREDQQPEAEALQLREPLERTGDQAKFFRPEHVPDLLVDRAVAVEQDEPAAHEGLHTRPPACAWTPWERNANSANWPPSASSAVRTAG